MKRWNLLQYILHPIDVLSILFAFQCSYLINNWSEGGLFLSDLELLQLFLWVLPVWLAILALIKVTRIPTKRHKVLFFLYLQSSVSIFFILTFIDLFLKLHTIPRLFLAEVSIFGFLFLFFGRILVYHIMKGLGVKGYNHINTIIVADDNSSTFIENLLSRKELGYSIVVIFTESELIRSKFENIAIILPGKFLGILNDLIKVDFVDEVLYLKEEPDAADFREILRSCEDLGVTLRLKAKESKIKLSSATTKDIADGRFLSFDNIPNNSYAMAIRKTMDINIALLMIVVLLPVLVLISLIIKLTSKGPIISIFSKTGWRGQQIKVYRFRTMVEYNDMRNNLYQEGMIRTEKEGNEKFTKIGMFLHLSGLDQLPQLFNVLKGEIPIIVIKHPLQAD
jgi:Bacterial sugar transferase/CoA-binding domain